MHSANNIFLIVARCFAQHPCTSQTRTFYWLSSLLLLLLFLWIYFSHFISNAIFKRDHCMKTSNFFCSFSIKFWSRIESIQKYSILLDVRCAMENAYASGKSTHTHSTHREYKERGKLTEKIHNFFRLLLATGFGWKKIVPLVLLFYMNKNTSRSCNSINFTIFSFLFFSFCLSFLLTSCHLIVTIF